MLRVRFEPNILPPQVRQITTIVFREHSAPEDTPCCEDNGTRSIQPSNILVQTLNDINLNASCNSQHLSESDFTSPCVLTLYPLVKNTDKCRKMPMHCVG
jgi:hypothetical protein